MIKSGGDILSYISLKRISSPEKDFLFKAKILDFINNILLIHIHPTQTFINFKDFSECYVLFKKMKILFNKEYDFSSKSMKIAIYRNIFCQTFNEMRLKFVILQISNFHQNI